MTHARERVDAIVCADWLLQPQADGGFALYSDPAVVIDDGCIHDIGRAEDIIARYEAAELTTRSDSLISPGFVNCHVHTCQQLARGLADDLPVGPWLDRVVSFEAAMDEEAVLASVRLACLEMIRNGTLGFVEACANPLYVDAVAEQFVASGLRGVLTRSVVEHREDDWSAPTRFMESAERSVRATEEMIHKWHGAGDGRLTAWVSWRHQQDVSNSLLKRLASVAREAAVGIQAHMATREWGELERLEHLGVLDLRYIFAHGIHYSERDLELLRYHDLAVSHNPGASMHGAYGSSVRGRFPEMVERGIRVCLGSDAAANNNVLDMTRETRLFATLYKETRADASLISPSQALWAATVNGYQACGWDDEIPLHVGASADLIVTSLKRPHLIPLHALLANVVYCMNGVDVTDSMVAGSWLLRDGKCLTLDEARVMEEAAHAASRIVKRWEREYGHTPLAERQLDWPAVGSHAVESAP